MGAILSSLPRTVTAAFLLAAIVFFGLNDGMIGPTFWQFVFRWLHIISGIMWIGHLWYFNFTQMPTMPKIPAELKGGVSKYIAPEALFWFRWGAMATLITGLILGWTLGGHQYLHDALTLQENLRPIGVGMWLAIIMFFNVWAIIWPNQKKALGIVQVDADATAKAARTAMLFSRTNTMLSLAMLVGMISQSHPG